MPTFASGRLEIYGRNHGLRGIAKLDALRRHSSAVDTASVPHLAQCRALSRRRQAAHDPIRPRQRERALEAPGVRALYPVLVLAHVRVVHETR
jgi:hypothetical protein